MDGFFNPVIFVPGILGCELRDAYAIDPRTVFSARSMLPMMDKLTDDYDRIALHPDDGRYERIEPARVEADRLISMVYEEFILELRHSLSKDPQLPTPVYPFPYDWRQPLERIEGLLEAFIEEVIDRTSLLRHYADSPWNQTRKVNLVGHSMGGLVITGLLTHKPEVGKRVEKVATIATPYRGSIESVSKICLGTSTLAADGSSSREREAARMTPSLYYLLPSYEGAVVGAGFDLFKAECWQVGVLETLRRYLNAYSVKLKREATMQDAQALLQTMLTSAGDHRRSLEANDKPPGGLSAEDWLVIAGVGSETRTYLKIDRPYGDTARFTFPTADKSGGDNTVPVAGAIPSFIDKRHIVTVRKSDFSFGEIGNRLMASGIGLHASLPSMNLVQRLVVSMFQGNREGSAGGRPLQGTTKKNWLPPNTLGIK